MLEDGATTIVVPIAVITVLVNLAIALVSRMQVKKVMANGNGNVMLKLINQVKDGQDDCQSCLNEVKLETVLQTDVLKDIREILRKESKHGTEQL